MSLARPIPLWVETRTSGQERPLPADWAPWLVVGAMTLIFAAVFAWLSVTRHVAYQTHAFDLGNMDQAVWSILHGLGFRFTDMQVGQGVLTSRLAIHVEPDLLLLAPLYLIHSGPETLLVVQAVVVALGAIPAYLLARTALRRPWLALAFPAAYLLHPSLQSAVLYDFHAVTLSACFLMWTLYLAYRNVAPRWFALCALLAMGTKEEIGLLIAAIGLGIALLRRSPAGLLWTALGAGWFLLCVLWIIPQHNPAGHSPYLLRYAYLGHGVGGIVMGAIHRPGALLHVLTSPSRVTYVDTLLRPLGYLPLLGLPVVLLALPSILINMLSTDAHMYSGQYQYNAEIVPFLVAAAILATATLSHSAVGSGLAAGRWVSVVLCLFLLSASVLADWRHGYTPLSQGYTIPTAGSHQQLEGRMLRAIPDRAVVAASGEIEPHLSDRPWIYLLPTIHPRNGPAAQYIVLDASIPSLPFTPRKLHRRAAWAMSHGYAPVSGRDGILILRRAVRQRPLLEPFYRFIFAAGPIERSLRVNWGPLRLLGVSVHPRNGRLTQARPDIDANTFWRLQRGFPRGASVRIALYVSPVYLKSPPAFSPRWRVVTDSPTWDWLPVRDWPLGKRVQAELLPVVPPATASGKVDVAIGVSGLGPARGIVPMRRVVGAPNLVRVATVHTGG